MTKAKKFFKFIVGFSASGVLLAFLAVGIAYAIGELQWNSGAAVKIHLDAYYNYGTRTSDGYYIVATEESSVSVQKLDSDGNLLWNGGNPVNLTGYDSIGEIVADGSGGAFLVHEGTNISNSDVRLSHVDSSGTISWTAGPFDTQSDYWPRVIYDGNGGAYVAWWRSDRSVEVTHIGSDGDLCDVATCGADWNSGGSGTYKPLTLPTHPTSPTRPEPRMTLSDSGSVIIPYTVNGGFDIVKLDTDGSTLWGPVSITDPGYYYMAEPDGSNGIFLAYWNNSGSDRNLKLARIDSSGTIQVGTGAGGITVKTFTTATASPNSLVSASDGAGSFFLGWGEDDVASGESLAYAQKYNTSGAEQWTTGGVLLFPDDDGRDDYLEVTYLYNLPHTIVSDGTGGAIIASNTFGSGVGSAVIGQKVTSGGALDWGDGIFLTEDTANDYDFQQDVISDTAGGAIFDWYQYDATDTNNYVVAQAVKTGATPPSQPSGGGSSGPSCTVFPTKINLPATLDVSEQGGKPVVEINWSQGRTTDSTADQKIKVFTDYLSQEKEAGDTSLRDTFVQSFYEDVLNAEGSDLAQKFESKLKKGSLNDLGNMICDPEESDTLFAVVTSLMDDPDAKDITLKFINDLIDLEDNLSTIQGYNSDFSAYYSKNFKLPSENTFDDITVEIYRDGKKIYSEKNPQTSAYLDKDVPTNNTSKVQSHNYFILTSTECDTKIGSTGKAYINPQVEPGEKIDVTANLSIRVKNGYTQLFREKIGALIEAARANNKARFGISSGEQSGVLKLVGGDLARLDLRRDVFSYSDDEKELIMCGGLLPCDQKMKDMISDYFKGSSHAAELGVEVYNEDGELVYQTGVTTDIFGGSQEFKLGQFLAGDEYSIKTRLKNEKFVLPKLSKVILNSAEPASGGTFKAHLNLNYDKQFRYGNFDDSNDRIDRNDILAWGRLIAQQSGVSKEADLDGVDGIDLLDVITFQQNWGEVREVRLEESQITLTELAKIFGLTSGSKELVSVPGWIDYLQQTCP